MEQIAEVMNNCFQSVFTSKSDFGEQRMTNPEGVVGLNSLEVSMEEVKKIMEQLDKRKVMGPDGISNWIFNPFNMAWGGPCAEPYPACPHARQV